MSGASAPTSRNIGGTLLLVDTETPEPEHRDWGWLRAALAWFFPWPAILLWLFVGTIVLHGLVGAIFAAVTMVVFGWRASKLFSGVGGLSDYQQ